MSSTPPSSPDASTAVRPAIPPSPSSTKSVSPRVARSCSRDPDALNQSLSAPPPLQSGADPSTPRGPSRVSITEGSKGMGSLENYQFVDEIGEGSFSTVKEAIYLPTGNHYAIKIISKVRLVRLDKGRYVRYAAIEKKALVTLSSKCHPGIVRCYATFQDSSFLYFVLSLAPNGTLKSLVNKYGSLSLGCARYYIALIIDAVLWMHTQGVLHRDLKPENILLDSAMRPKITDFGSAYVSEALDLSPRPSSFVGSPGYVAPELISRDGATCSDSSDLWTLGCLLYCIMTGHPPFTALTDYLCFEKIKALDYTFPNGFDLLAQDLIRRLLVLDPSARLGVSPKSFPDALRAHRFFVELALSGSASEHDATQSLDWGALWTMPAPTIESGLTPAPSRAEVEAVDWDALLRSFSLSSGDDQSRDSAPSIDPSRDNDPAAGPQGSRAA